MERRFCRSQVLVPLLAALILGATAAAPSPEETAIREIRALVDKNQLELAEERVVSAVQRFGASDGAWALRVLHADILIKRGKPAAVFDALGEALPERLATSETAVNWHMNRGIALHRIDRKKDADGELTKALALAKAHHPKLLPTVLFVVAQFGTPKPFSESERYFLEAIRLAKAQKNEGAELKARAALALRYTFAERYTEAIKLNEVALGRQRALGLIFAASQTAGNLGWAYEEIGDYESAADYFSQALDLAQRGGATLEAIRWMSQVGSVRRAQRDNAGATKLYGDALALARANKYKKEIAESLSNLADISLETGRVADARRYSAEALQIKRATNDDAGELKSLITEARIASSESRFEEAETTLKRVASDAKETATRWTAQYRLAETYGRARRNDLADAAYRLAIDTADDARKDVSQELRLSFFNLVDELHDTYVDFLVDKGRIEDALRVVDERRALTLAEGLKRDIAPKKLDPRKAVNDAGATLLCYSLGRAHSYLWTVTSTAITIATLPADREINAKVDAYQRSLLSQHGTLQASGARGQELYRALVSPAAGAIARGSRVIIIPDGQLHMLNFETLVVPSPQPHYWIEDVIVISAPSIQLLARNAPSTRPAKSMLLIGDVPQADAQFPPLKYAATEVNKVAARFSGETILRGASAKPSSYAKASPGNYEFLHFVAHGVATRQKPLDSAIILAPDGDQYKLYAREIIEHPLQARLVTISSCHGAGTRAYAGEGLVGLAWAFLRAGAGQVIAALWEVNDSTTPQLMDEMYKGIHAGRDPAVALRDAKLSLVHSTGIHRLPRYWAPFVLYSGS